MEALTYTISEACSLLRISRNTAYTLAAQGQLPVVRLGRRVLVSRRGLDALLTGGWQPQQSPNGS